MYKLGESVMFEYWGENFKVTPREGVIIEKEGGLWIVSFKGDSSEGWDLSNDSDLKCLYISSSNIIKLLKPYKMSYTVSPEAIKRNKLVNYRTHTCKYNIYHFLSSGL